MKDDNFVLLCAETVVCIEDLINSYLNEGYTFRGEMFIHYQQYHQAMYKEPKKQRKTPQKITEASGKFYEWYKLYPVKKGKSTALKSWNKLKMDDYMADHLIVCLKMQIKYDAQWKAGIGIPHPSTYLNQKRWNDEIVKESSDEKPDWAKIPRDDNQLWDFAKKYNYPGPGHMTYSQYRQFLNSAVEKRLSGEKFEF